MRYNDNMTMQEYKLSVAICAVDETVLLKRTFEKIYAFGKQHEYLFVLSQTCSRECLETVESICQNYPDCRYVFQSGKGLGNAMQDAFKIATGTHILVWSADDAIDAAVFLKLLELSKQNPDAIVKISRWLPGGSLENYGAIKKAINFVSQKMFAWLFHSELTDFTNPTQIAPLKVYRSMEWENQDASFSPEMVFKPLLQGCRFLEVPCKTKATSKKNTHIRFSEHIRYYCIIFKLRFRKNRD